MQADTINRENIERMVMRFYTKVLDDRIVGPFFIQKLGDDMYNARWQPHLALLVDFWSSIALGENSYRGNPFMPHTQLGVLTREVFEQWLHLFGETVDEIYVPQVAEQFKARSAIIAGNFMRNLGIY